MFKKSKATSVESYLANVPPERSEAIHFLHKFIQKSVPSLKPHFAYNMLGYGSMKYVNHKKEKIDWPVVALACQKQYISIYVCATIGGKYIAEMHKASLGNVSVGKSCIRIKKLDDLKLEALDKVLKLAEKNPGYGSVEERRAASRNVASRPVS